MKKQTKEGFALGIILVIVVVLGLVGGLGYKFFIAADTQTDQPAQQAQLATPVGTTGSIDNLITQDASSEVGIDASHASNDQAVVQSSDTAANNLGGTYDESAF